MIRLAAGCVFSFLLLPIPAPLVGQIQGFTQPFRQVELASDESGLISELLVDEGSPVTEGEVVARLDDRVQQLQLDAARHRAASTSSLEAARQSLDKRTTINQRLKELADNGNATESEIIRAELEHTIAHSRYMAAQEEQVGYQIEQRRAELMLERRSIRTPISGVVSAIHRREGEFLSPLHAEVMTVVDTRRLLAVFNVPSNQLDSLRSRKTIPVRLGSGQVVEGQLHAAGVLTDAESGTVQVKIVFENPGGKFRSGEPCVLEP